MTHLILPLVLMPFLTFNSSRNVELADIYIRDAATKEPMAVGHYDHEVTYWVPDIPPRFTRRGVGPLRNGHFSVIIEPGESHRVLVGGKGYCESTFQFRPPRGMRGKVVIRDWTVAEVTNPDCPASERRIEYRIVRRVPKKD